MKKQRCILEIYAEKSNLLKKMKINIITENRFNNFPYWIITNKKHKYIVKDDNACFLRYGKKWIVGKLIEPDLMVFCPVYSNGFGRDDFRI